MVRDLEAACERQRAGRESLRGLSVENRIWNSHVDETARSCLTERGRALLDRGWTTAEIADLYQQAQAVADAAMNAFLDKHAVMRSFLSAATKVVVLR